MASNTLTKGNFLSLIQDLILEVEVRMRSQAEGHHEELGAALEHLLSSGGKRIRPAVALLTGGMLGAEKENLITMAAAIELLHTATLVHDDLIDGALLRRGIATLNSRWTPAATVLTGDFIFAQAARLASETNTVPVIKLFAETLSTIVNGEITQMFSSPGLANRDEYYQRIYAKTASMFELASAAAAILSPVEPETVEQMRSFGYDIGMAFQIVDDILDFTGEQATVGKPVASDLRQGIVTLPVLYYIESHQDDPDLGWLRDGRIAQDAAVNHLVNAIRASGAIQQSLEEARRFIQSGLSRLDKMPDGPERVALVGLAEYVVDRQL